MDLEKAMGVVRSHNFGTLVTLKRNGMAQLANVSYLVDEAGTIRIPANSTTAKAHNLRRDPRAMLHVSYEDMWAYVVVEGTVTLSDVAQDPNDEVVEELVAWHLGRLGERDDWDEYRQWMVDWKRLMIRFTPNYGYGPDRPYGPAGTRTVSSSYWED
jgi:PPOX class probable F420-dependent enzyme